MNEDLYASWSIKIGGNFFDSFIYSGKLYLVTTDRKIRCIHWDRLINSLIQSNNEYAVGLRLAFLDSSAIYKVGGKLLTVLSSDADIDEVFRKKILKGLRFSFKSVDEISVQHQCIYEKTIDLETLPADMLIYGKRIFLCAENGLTEIPLKKSFPLKLTYRFWDKANKVSDLPFVHISSASYGHLLLSGLSDGVWQYALGDYGDKQQLRQLSASHCSFATRDYNDYVSGSYVDESYLIERKVIFGEKHEYSDEGYRKRITSTIRQISLNKWFGKDNGFYFSRNYLVYCIADGHIYSSTKNKILSDNTNHFDLITTYDIDLPKKSVLEAQVEVFGLVIEYDDRIIVLFADGHKKEIRFNDRKLTSWRTFPESKNYLNQLHLIFENEMEIHSFNGPALTINRKFGFDYRFGVFE